MSYLLDKKNKQKKIVYGGFFIFIFIFFFYFRVGVWKGLSFVGHNIFRPVLVLGNSVGNTLSNFKVYLSFTSSLLEENKNLKIEIENNKMSTLNHQTLLSENVDLKNILNRKIENKNMILGAILSKPNQNAYDIILIDIGTKNGVQVGDKVFAYGNVPIGRVDTVYEDSANVTLFSTSGEKTQVVVSDKNVYMELVGRGGGNFEMILPRDFVLTKGDTVNLPGINPRVVGIVETILSDPRDPFIKALIVSPVNIQELKFVEVEL
jgi:cell shape-determining protein MreC